MNIGMLLYAQFPFDIRIEKEARTLINAGYKVFLCCENRENQLSEEIIDNIHVWRLKTSSLKKKIAKYSYMLNFIYPNWEKEITKFIRKFHIDVLHVHDLPLIKTALKTTQSLNIPLVADLHENYPAAKKVYLTQNNYNYIIRRFTVDRYTRWKKHEEKVLKKVDRIIIVVPEAGERFKRYGIDLKKIYVVSNTEDTYILKNQSLDKSISEKYKNDFIIGYIGGLGIHRGIDTALRAMSFVHEKAPQAKLLLVGSDNKKWMRHLKNIITKEEINKQKIIFTGYKPFSKMYSYLNICDICLVPHNYSEHTDTTIPHKLFQYMLMRKPAIVSNCRPLARIVKETKSGLVFQANNAEDLARKILILFNNKKLRVQLGRNGERAVLKKYNWQNDAEVLLSLYRSLGKKNEK